MQVVNGQYNDKTDEEVFAILLDKVRQDCQPSPETVPCMFTDALNVGCLQDCDFLARFLHEISGRY